MKKGLLLFLVCLGFQNAFAKDLKCNDGEVIAIQQADFIGTIFYSGESQKSQMLQLTSYQKSGFGSKAVYHIVGGGDLTISEQTVGGGGRGGGRGGIGCGRAGCDEVPLRTVYYTSLVHADGKESTFYCDPVL